MDLPRPLQNLITLANSINRYRDDKKITVTATLVTGSNEQIKLIMPSGFARFSLYAVNYSDDFRIKAQIQPGVYLEKILPSKDNLFIEIIERVDLTQTLKRYRATPIGDSNPQIEGNSSQLANLSAKDSINMVTVQFQLMEVGYALLKNVQISDRHLMSSLDTVLHYQLTKYGKELKLTGEDAWKGVDIERPIDNPDLFKIISLVPTMRLPRLGSFLQNHEEFGIYSKGFGMYYSKGMWRVYPLFKVGRYDKAKKVLNIYRLPEDVFPTLHGSHFTQGKITTILSTGSAKHIDGNDIAKQNQGIGKRIINANSVMGETGVYYDKGVAAVSREDTLSEYQMSSRRSGEEIVPFAAEPTGNLCKHLTTTSFNEGDLVNLQWNNSDHSLLEPAIPVRFFYMSGDVLKYKEGTLLAARTELQRDTESPNFVFRQHSALCLWLLNQEINAE